MGLVAVLTALRDNDEPLRDPLLVLAQRVGDTADDMLLLTQEYSKAAEDPLKQFNCGCLQWHDLSPPPPIQAVAVTAPGGNAQRAASARSGGSSAGGAVVSRSGSGAAAGSGFRVAAGSGGQTLVTEGFLQAEAAGRAFAFESLKLQIGELMVRMMSKLQVCTIAFSSLALLPWDLLFFR